MRIWSSSAVAAGLCLLLAPSISNAATIYACKKKIGGTIRIVGAKTVCLATEKKMSWPDAAEVAALKALVTTSQAQVAALQNLLQHFTRNGNDISITGANLWVKSGSGSTDGAVNGHGNLIVGYNELRGAADNRTGSHNLIVGQEQNYSSFGGLVAGFQNTISGQYATVSGGAGSSASGVRSSVSGGIFNTAGGDYSSVSGGSYNSASGGYASVSGGNGNTASGDWSTVAGGGGSIAADGNIAVANFSSILGGARNITGDATGADHTIAIHSTVSGGYNNRARGTVSSVSGGQNNAAIGWGSSVSGGRAREVAIDVLWQAGDIFSTVP